MNILCKVSAKVTGSGQNQLVMLLKKDVIEKAKLVKGDLIEMTVLENGSILIEKSK